MCSLTDFIEVSPWSVRLLANTATVTGRGTPQVDTSVRGGDFSWPQVGTFVATSGDLRWPPAGTFSWPRTPVTPWARWHAPMPGGWELRSCPGRSARVPAPSPRRGRRPGAGGSTPRPGPSSRRRRWGRWASGPVDLALGGPVGDHRHGRSAPPSVEPDVSRPTVDGPWTGGGRRAAGGGRRAAGRNARAPVTRRRRDGSRRSQAGAGRLRTAPPARSRPSCRRRTGWCAGRGRCSLPIRA